MQAAQRQRLRKIMQLAWGLYRADLNGPEPRTFADALAGAWRWTKRNEATAAPAWAKGSRPRSVAFASMVQSPIRRSLSGPYTNARAYSAGYVTSRLGR